MTEELKQKIKEEMVKLPKEAQEVINTFDWVKISEEIGKKNLLDDDEVNILQSEIGLILIETNRPDMLTIKIEDNIGTSKNEAIKIEKEIREKIFTPMLKKNNNIYEIGEKYKLQIDQVGEIEKETERFLNGEILSSDYEKNILSITKLSEPDFSSLLKDLNEIILKKREEKEDDSEVPIPPYRANEGEKESSVRDQEEISKEIEQIQSNNYREPVPENDKLSESEHNIYKESGIEMLKEKLGGVKIVEQKENDYSLPKIKNTGMEFETNSKQSLNHDLYREEI